MATGLSSFRPDITHSRLLPDPVYRAYPVSCRAHRKSFQSENRKQFRLMKLLTTGDVSFALFLCFGIAEHGQLTDLVSVYNNKLSG